MFCISELFGETTVCSQPSLVQMDQQTEITRDDVGRTPAADMRSTPASGLPVRSMSEADLKTALQWAATEGWNPAHGDVGPMLEGDPEGFFVGHLDGQPVASVSAVRYGKDYGFIGM